MKFGRMGASGVAGSGSITPPGPTPIFQRDYEATGSLGTDAAFARSSNASFFDAVGDLQVAAPNVARFDYSGGTRALFMELNPATNLVDWSNDIQQPTWVHTNITVANASEWAFTAQYSSLLENVLTVAGQMYTKSHYVRNIDGNANIVHYRGQSASGNTAPIAPPLTNEFVYYTDTFSGRTGNGNVGCGFMDTNTSGWGSHEIQYTQVEDGSVATSYIETTGAAATRAGETLSYTGISASNETRCVVDGADVDIDNWTGVIGTNILGADGVGRISSITVWQPGERPA